MDKVIYQEISIQLAKTNLAGVLFVPANAKAMIIFSHGEVLQLNKQAFKELWCDKELVIVEGAGHLFEENGKLDEVSRLACYWFEKYLKPVPAKNRS